MKIRKRFIAIVMSVCIVTGLCLSNVPTDAEYALVSAENSVIPSYSIDGKQKSVVEGIELQ